MTHTGLLSTGFEHTERKKTLSEIEEVIQQIKSGKYSPHTTVLSACNFKTSLQCFYLHIKYLSGNMLIN